MNILMHTRPMRRHTQPVEPAECQALVRLAGTHPNPGLHLLLVADSGATQLVIFPAAELEKLAQAVAIARAGW